MATSEAVRGAGLLTNFWKRVEAAIRKVGGTDEHLSRLDKAETMPAIEQFAELVVRGAVTSAVWFRFLIRLGHFDDLWGFAERPEEIKGQVFHPVTEETELDCPGQQLRVKQAYARYSGRMASLSELLDYGIRNPEAQREFPIRIVWKVGGRFWSATLEGYAGRRRLNVTPRDSPDDLCDYICRFLVRKSD